MGYKLDDKEVKIQKKKFQDWVMELADIPINSKIWH